VKIGIDVSQTGAFKMGCGYFADSLTRHLIASETQNEYILYPTFGYGYWDPDWPSRTLTMPNRRNVSRVAGQRRLDELEAFWIDPADDLEQRLGSPDIVQSNNFFCPTTFSHAQIVYTLYDLAFLSHPEWTPEANWRTCFEGVFNASLYAAHILAISNYSRDEFLRNFPHYPPERVSVVYAASRFNSSTRVEQPESLGHLRPRHFWLTTGQADPRKNQPRLFEAYARLVAAGQTSDPLVLFGTSDSAWANFAPVVQRLGIEGLVQRLRYVDDVALAWLYGNCTAFVYPSLFEGFGLPVVEAMSLGGAVVTSKVTSLPEVVGEAGLLVEPSDVAAIQAAMAGLAANPDHAQRMRVDAAERAAQFSWPRIAARVLEIYQMVHAEDPRSREEKGLVGSTESR
jgi:glycosyltransferase involved in cell wall biosynthesis